MAYAGGGNNNYGGNQGGYGGNQGGQKQPEKVITHKWAYNLNYNTENQDNPFIQMSVFDDVTKENYRLQIFKNEYNNDPKFMGEQYTQLQKDLEACDMAINYVEHGPLEVTFKRKDGTTHSMYKL
eukprot:CAMPEP_0201565846 /NCGR_PEP_ID=MMETSP0190_2-20130828/5270_1 /ASSEMBLY_ACC=CAM_ASM_000263 /TAXON_ID=37353 /ORGANISM="Rosalina sp." /LENGTH=124 /DNA_ID=CAMNT_0047983817 /DNA_START=74 /DNA_END=445 /DNA_ORIENTATION=-